SPGNGVREMLFRDELRKQRAADGAGEGTDDAEKNEHCEDVVDRANAPPGGEKQQSTTKRKADVTAQDKFAAIIAIGHVAGNEKEKDTGQELRQANEAEIERPLGDFVDLPAHRNRLHLVGKDDAETCRLEKQKTWILEGGTAGGGRVLWF